MKPTLLSTAFLASAASLALAGDPDWRFQKGQTYTYECKTEFHYVATTFTQEVNGQKVQRGGTYTPGSNSRRGRRRPSSDPQWETIVLRLTVFDVDKDGNATLEGMIENVRIHTRFDSTGEEGLWDSKTACKTDIPGFKRYEAIRGFRFGARVAPDGTVLAVEDAQYPEADRAPALPQAREGEQVAGEVTHDPTPAAAWLSMIFEMGPDRGNWKRRLELPFVEKVEGRTDGKESVGNLVCVRTKLKTSEEAREPGPDRPIVQSLEQVTLNGLREADKKGRSWFSREHALLVKSEMTSSFSEVAAGALLSATFKWEVELKAIGKVGPAAGPELPPDFEPVEPTAPGGGTEVQGAAK
jgi:hypothetical protein